MKKILLNLVFSLLSFSFLMAQNVPQGINYQAVARDAKGQLIAEKSINVQISLIGNIEREAVVYREVHHLKTNKYGLFDFVIGKGESLDGDFEEIPWESAQIWLEVAIDENAGQDYTVVNTTRLLTVPYAFHAGSANELVPINPNGDGRVPWWGQPWWNIEGLERTNPDKHFIGNIDSVDLVFRTNNLERLRIKADGEIVMPGDVEIGGSLQVNGDSTIVQNLYVQGNEAIIDNILNVGGDATFGDNVSITNNINVDGNSALNGQVTIDATVGGGDGSYGAYPLRVQGSAQGIAVKVNGSRNNSNNFVSFWDDNGIQGRIEGQTASEIQNSFDYIWNNALFGAQAAILVAGGAACAPTIVDACSGGVLAAEGALIAAQTIEYNINLLDNEGVAYESSNGDYAEWLEKANHEESFSYGDIVGVKGGKISKTINAPDHYMVVSKSPIVLGNMPPQDREADFEKIAFMGQVPVKVRGKVNIGDYIVPSNLHDGFGIAVSPQEITFDQLEQIVGVAWSESNNVSISMINLAVGINTNDAVNKIQQQQNELNSVKNQLNTIVSYLKAKDADFDATLFDVGEENNVAIKSNESKQTAIVQIDENPNNDILFTGLENNPELISIIQTETRRLLDEKGIDYNLYEQTRRLVTDETYFVNVMQQFYTPSMEGEGR